MDASANRRGFIQAALSVAGLSILGRAGAAHAGERSAALSTEALAEDILLVSGAGANVIAARDANGVLLVDGGLQAHSDRLLKLVRKELGDKRIHTLFNTHWHPEQTGCNDQLGKAGARIIAHENTRLWLRTAAPLISGGSYGPLVPHACPNATIYTESSIPFGAGQIEYGYLLQAHTDGDIYVFFKEANLLAIGGVISTRAWPMLDWGTNGWIGGMVAGLRKLTALANAGTRIVPSNGAVLSHAELSAQAEMYATIFGRLQKLLRAGMSPAEAVAAKVTQEFDAQFGNSEQFVTQAFKSLWGHMTPDA